MSVVGFRWLVVGVLSVGCYLSVVVCQCLLSLLLGLVTCGMLLVTCDLWRGCWCLWSVICDPCVVVCRCVLKGVHSQRTLHGCFCSRRRFCSSRERRVLACCVEFGCTSCSCCGLRRLFVFQSVGGAFPASVCPFTNLARQSSLQAMSPTRTTCKANVMASCTLCNPRMRNARATSRRPPPGHHLRPKAFRSFGGGGTHR